MDLFEKLTTKAHISEIFVDKKFENQKKNNLFESACFEILTPHRIPPHCFPFPRV